uniref:Family with sequence similarity 193 member A n=1 Tax=Hucho hucho TaxID=62062 RepID=A0A4W5P6G9_9TELE
SCRALCVLQVPMNGNVTPQFSEGPVNSDFSGALQTPFTFGLSQRAPYSTTGDRCLLCRSERKPDSTLHPDTGLPGAGQNGMAQPPKSPSTLQLPLWVCPDCRRTVEKEDRHASLEQSQDFLLHMPVGNGGLGQELPAAGGRLTNGGTPPTLPTLPVPDLTTPMTADTVCSCETCNERREISAESERESQLLQNHWSEVRYLVRCIYRQSGTPLADDQDQPLDRDKEGMKELVDRLCEKDPYQLYQRLEQQAREYVLEMKVRLLKHLSTGSKAAAVAAQGPPQAHQFISLLLEEYSALCQAARTISSFLLTLEKEHLQRFQVTWELHNKHLFENLVFSEPILHSSLPALVAQLSSSSCCQQDSSQYLDDDTLKTKQRMLKEDWEFFKQRRFIEEQLTNSKKSVAGDSNFTDTMRMLSSRLSIPDCPNCDYRRRCTCDDCSLSHILTCGITDSPIAEDLHIKLPLQATEPPQHRDYLAEVHPPSLSSGGSSASASASSSPVTIQQHSRLILPEGVEAWPHALRSEAEQLPYQAVTQPVRMLSMPIPLAPTSSHTGPKQQAFSPSLPDHVYQNCFGGGAGDWNSSLQCLSLKFENICDTAMMKNWNPSGTCWDHPTTLTCPSPRPPPPAMVTTERKNGAKKKCLYNFQDAFLEANKVVMATSASSASVSCTATTVQSSNNHIHVSSKRPNSLGDVFHNIGKEDHRQQPGPIAPRNSPTGLASLPHLSSGPALPPAPGPTAQHHYPSMGSQPFPTTATPAPGFMEAHHQGMCLSPAEPPAAAPADGAISAPPSVCSDPECEGHRCEGNGAYDHQGYDGEESQDEDSCSEHSSSTSTSTNQKEGKYCDCCYCEFFGHGGPPAAPTSRNYAEMREKLRLRLTKRKEEQPKREEQPAVVERDSGADGMEDHRRVEDLLQFINSASDNKPVSSSKAAKRARHKQKKMEEKVRLEAEAREREEEQVQQLLEEEQRQREEEEEALQRELLRLQDLQHLRAAKKKKEKAKELAAPVPQNNPQPLKQTAQNVLENLRNGKSQLLHSLMRLPGHKDPRVEQRPQTRPPPSQHSPKNSREKAPTPAPFTPNAPNSPSAFLLNGTSVAPQLAEANGKAKPKQQQPIRQTASETTMVKKAPEATTTKSTPQLPPDVKVNRPRPPAEDPVVPLAPGPRKEERNNGKRQHHQQSASQVKEERSGPLMEPSQPPASQMEQPQQNGKPLSAESPQPKAKAKKNKKKKADKTNNSIDDVFLPKDIDLDSTDMDETEREVEYFKRFCLDSARQTRQRLSINWSNFSLKKAAFAAH